MKKLAVILFYLVSWLMIQAQVQVRKPINIPDISGFVTLKCDFHMHTVFSDGEVWPTVRVEEAWRDGLDAIAITDHLNYKWSFLKEYVNSSDANASYNIAKLTADRLGITLINGCEINRGMPPGHFNILFAKDLNQLKDSDFFVALTKAKDQGAYIQWNHPGIGQKQPIQWFDVHERLYKQGLLQGIEIYNQKTLYPEAIGWANEKKLTVTCGSDIHELLDRIVEPNSHRPVTLVFAKDRSVESIREALLEGRTAAYFGNELVGHKEHLLRIFQNSVSVIDLPMIIENKAKYIEFNNNSDIDYSLELYQKVAGVELPKELKLLANRAVLFKVIPGSEIANAPSFKAKYIVKNLHSISGEEVLVEFEFKRIGTAAYYPYLKEKYPEVK